MTSLNGVRKLRLTAKETSIASFEVLDVIKCIAVQGIFEGIIIKASAAGLQATNLLFATKNVFLRSLAVCCLLISIIRFSELFRPAVKQKHNRTTKRVCIILFFILFIVQLSM